MKIANYIITILIILINVSCAGTQYHFLNSNKNDAKQHSNESNCEYLHRLGDIEK